MCYIQYLNGRNQEAHSNRGERKSDDTHGHLTPAHDEEKQHNWLDDTKRLGLLTSRLHSQSNPQYLLHIFQDVIWSIQIIKNDIQ